ncbi:MAG TPA: tetratricopeptide repeat protein [Bacteroidia bacterium]|jgi:outer membrane protein OmpA-like peptidoglycan-associated protein/tetratricopeptide (TPR) repeat protein|nr:tetratricopeptide repeat protein [Bacteroidia bacterium]
MMKLKVVLLTFLLFSVTAFSQTAKKFAKQAKKDFKVGNYDAAAANYTKALELKPNYYRYLNERARSYEFGKKYSDALKDYKSCLSLKSSDKKLLMKVADLSMGLNDYAEAVTYLERITTSDRKNIPAWQKASFSYLKLKKFDVALEKVNKALDVQRYNHVSHYYKALALDSLKDLPNANLEYISAIRLMKNEDPNDIKPLPKYKPYYINHAWAMHRVFDFDNSIKEFDIGLSLDPADTVEPKKYYVYYLRSQPLLAKSDYVNSIGDLSKALVDNPKFTEAFFLRGKINKKTSQFQGAINDFTKTIQLDPKNFEAVYLRGQCYLELGNYPDAIADLKRANEINPNNAEAKKLLRDAQDKNYQANKESDAPMLIIAYPQPDNAGFINVYTNQFDVVFEGEVRDKSLIQEIKINGIKVPFNSNEKNPFFNCKVPINNADKMEITVTDIYFNSTTKTFKVGRLIDNTRVKVAFTGKVLANDPSGKVYANKMVYITNEKGEVMYYTKTDEKGQFKFEKLPFDRNYLMTLDVTDASFDGIAQFKVVDGNGNTIIVSKSGEKGKFKFELMPSDVNLMTLMSVEDQPLHIDFKGRLVADNADKTPLAEIKFLLLNERDDIISFNTTDNNGGFNFTNLIPSGKYNFAIDALDSKKIPFDKIIVTDEKGKIIKEIVKNTEGVFKFNLLQSEKMMMSKISVEDFDPWVKLGGLNSGKKEIEIIENIYYESGSAKILPEAEVILKKAVDALNKNPKLVLEVQSHTDATAGDEYNMELSQKRANMVVEYLVAQGIDKKRLTARGFGETQLSNRCGNGVDCSDEEHKQNRRTVFKLSYAVK